MKRMKQVLVAAVCGAVALSLCACSYVTVNEDRDNAQTVATVNGVELKKDAYKDMLEMYLYNYGTTLEDIEQSAKESGTESTFKTDVLDSLIDEELLYQEAQKQGMVDNSDAHREEVRAEAQEGLDSMLEYYKSNAEQNGVSEEEALASYNEYVKNAGMEDMDAYVTQSIRQTAISEMAQKVRDEVDYTEEEAKAYYDEQVEVQAPLIEKDPTNYSLYESFDQAFAYPEGYRFVKHILTSIPDEAQQQISQLRSEGDDAAADVLRDEELAKIKTQADEVLAKVNAGEDFDALIEQYGSDPGMQSEPAKTYGYTVHEGATDLVKEFVDGAMGLKNVGDNTGLVPSDFGYHIIKYVEDAAGPIPFDMMKDEIISNKKNSVQSQHLTEYLDKLAGEADVKKYENRL